MKNTATTLISHLQDGLFDERLRELYVEETKIFPQRERYIQALKRFRDLYGDREVEVYSASGRTEVGGNHTDHQFGHVLAASVNLDSIAVVSKQEDNKVSLLSEGYPSIEMVLDLLKPVREEFGHTRGLIRGVAAGMKERGYRIGGFYAYVTSDVLSGSGLSSSAAFEILLGKILDGLYNDNQIDPVTNAIIGQYAENHFFGKPCGLMDQMACSVGGLIQIDFQNPESPVMEKVNTEFGDYHHSLCIVDTKGSHADLTEDYAAIPAEMKKAAAFFGQEILSRVSEERFYDALPKLRKKMDDRTILRSIHWFNENKRPELQARALESGDFNMFLKLVRESGDSSFRFLQNVFSNHKIKEQGLSLGIALSERILGDAGAVRVHGGGFAGTIQAFVPDDLVEDYQREIEKVFGEGSCYVLKIRKIGGVKVLD